MFYQKQSELSFSYFHNVNLKPGACKVRETRKQNSLKIREILFGRMTPANRFLHESSVQPAVNKNANWCH